MVKFLPVAVLGAVLSGCSMAGSGDYFADEYAQMQRAQMPHYFGGGSAGYGASPCQPIVVAPNVNGPCQPSRIHPNSDLYGTPSAPGYGHPVQPPHIQPTFGQNGCAPQAYRPMPPVKCKPKKVHTIADYERGRCEPKPYGQPVLPSGCAPSPYILNSHDHGYAHQGYAQHGYPEGQYGHGSSGGYDQGYDNGAYVPPSFGAPTLGLRGPSNLFRPHAYGNLGVVNYEAGEDLFGAQGRLGYQFNKYLGAEAEGSLGFTDDTRDGVLGTTPIEQTMEINNSVAGFGVLRYPLSGKFNGYGRLGYHRTEIDRVITDATSTLLDEEFTVDGIAYGGGLEYAFSPKTAVRLDYTSYDFDGPDADAVSLALSRKF